MRKTSLTLTILLLATIVLSACNMPAAEVATPSVSVEQLAATSAASTVSALTTQMALQPTNTPQPTATQAPTNTPQSILPTNTVPAVVVPVNTAAPTAAPVVCDRAIFVSDDTYPDGTDVKAGETFTKSWTLKNGGSCTWTTGYKLVFKSGNAMEGAASVALPTSVAPGATVKVSIQLKAPAANGTYTGNYKLQNANGVDFGVGASGGEAFWVKIDVVSGTGATATVGAGTPSATAGAATATPKPENFAIIGASVKSDATNYSGTCPVSAKITADIKVNRPGKITFYWVVDGTKYGETQTLEFASAGTQTLALNLTLSEVKTYKVGFHNDYPNNFTWETQFTVNCTSGG